MTINKLGNLSMNSELVDTKTLSSTMSVMDEKYDFSQNSQFQKVTVEPSLSSYLYDDGRVFYNLTDQPNSKTIKIPVAQGEELSITGKYCYKTRGYAFYDSYDKLISIYPDEKGSLEVKKFEQIVTAPENATTLVVSYFATMPTDKDIFPTVSRHTNNAVINDISTSLINDTNELKRIPTLLNVCKISSDTANFNLIDVHDLSVLGAYCYKNGNIGYDDKAKQYSKLLSCVPVIPGEKIKFTGQFQYTIRPIVFFDINNKVVGYYPSDDTSYAKTSCDETMTVPNTAAYAHVTLYGTWDGDANKYPTISRYTNTDILNNIYNDISALSNDISTLSIDINEIQNQITDSAYTKAVKYVDYSKTMQKESPNCGYITGSGKIIVQDPSTSYRYSDLIDITHVKELIYTSQTQWDNCLYAIYDKNMIYLGGKKSSEKLVVNNEIINVEKIFEEFPTAKYIRFSTMNHTFPVSMIATHEYLTLNEYVVSSDYLYGKKWIACGDSFTRGGAINKPYDEFISAYNTYPNIIAKRHGMDLVMAAVDGGVMYDGDGHLLSDATKAHRVFVKNYEYLSNEISTADYMTISYGLNDSYNSESEISDKTSTNLSTVWGSYNTILSSVFTWNPGIKVALIISDGWMSNRKREEQIKIAQWWGIPYLDLYDDPKNSTMILNNGYIPGIPTRINPFVIQQRLSALTSEESNRHPTQFGQEFRSTMIENFLKTL